MRWDDGCSRTLLLSSLYDACKSNHYIKQIIMLRLSWWLSGKESSFQRREQGFDPWSGKTPHATGGTTEPVRHNCWAHTLEPVLLNESCPSSPHLDRKPKSSNEDPAVPKINKYICLKIKNLLKSKNLEIFFKNYYAVHLKLIQYCVSITSQ